MAFHGYSPIPRIWRQPFFFQEAFATMDAAAHWKAKLPMIQGMRAPPGRHGGRRAKNEARRQRRAAAKSSTELTARESEGGNNSEQSDTLKFQVLRHLPPSCSGQDCRGGGGTCLAPAACVRRRDDRKKRRPLRGGFSTTESL